MWVPRSILLLFCLLLLFIFSSNAFSQSAQVAPIKVFLSADSGKAGVIKAKVSLRPAEIHPSPIDKDRNIFNNQQTGGPIRAPASDSQWVSFHLSATQAQWYIRRPGEYAAQPIVGSITSNVDILMNFSGFEDLNASDPPIQNIETYYGVSIGNQSIEEVDWTRASDFNAHPLPIKKNPITPTYWTLWNKICVKPGNSANQYSDDATITLGMQNMSPWIDPEIPTGQ